MKIKNFKRVNYSILAGELIGAISSIAVGSSLSATGVGVVVGLPIVGSIVTCAGVLLTLTKYLYNKKRRRYSRSESLAELMKTDFEQLHKEAMMDKKIDEK